jgi:hypothetical protein
VTNPTPTNKLPRLTQGDVQLKSWANRLCIEIENQLNQIRDNITAILAVTKRDKRTASYTDPTQVLTASDAGASATITVENHARVYSDGTIVQITGGPLTALAYSTTYAVYYDDTTLADETPVFHASINLEDGAVGAADGRHVLGVITTPGSGGGDVTGGGSYPPGFTVGGEIP